MQTIKKLLIAWRTLGIGFIGLVVAFNLFIVALLIGALIFAIGLGLNATGLWAISVALWVVAYSAIIIALTALSLYIAYGATIVVAYHLTSWLAHKTSWPRTIWLAILALFVGTLIYTLLRSVPYAGWIIGLLVIAAGMGAAWLGWREAASPPRTVGIEATVALPKAPLAKPAKR